MAVKGLGEFGLDEFLTGRLEAVQLSEGQRIRSANGGHVARGSHDAVGQREAAGHRRQRILQGFILQPGSAAELPLIMGEEFYLVRFGFGGGAVLIHQG